MEYLDEIKYYADLCLEGYSTIQERYEIILNQKEAAWAQLIEEKHYHEIIIQVIPDDTNPVK